MNKKLITTLMAGVGLLAAAPFAQANNVGLEVLWSATSVFGPGSTVVDSPAQWTGASGSQGSSFTGTGSAAGWSGNLTVNWNSAGTPILDLQGYTITSSGAGYLALAVEENGITTLGSPVLDIGVTGNTFVGAQLGFYWNPANTVLAGSPPPADYLYSSRPLATGSHGYTVSVSSITGPAPFTLGIGLIVTGVGSISTDDQISSIPDGGATVMLLGAALSAMALFRKKLIA